MTGFIMSKSSQKAPARKPDPLAQYPERYSQADQDHQARYQRLKAAGHRVETWRHDPAGLRAYEEATKDNTRETDEQQLKRLANKKLDIEYERDHGEMRPKPEQYDESSQTEPPKISADRLADLKARSAATERRLQDAGLFAAGKGPPGLDPEFLRREKQRAETLRALKQDHPDQYDEEGQTEPPQEHPIHQIAREHLGIKSLTPRNSDRLDFHELGVSSIESALRAAYAAGQGASAQPKPAQPEPSEQPSDESREMGIQLPAPKNWRRGRRAGQVPG